MALNELKIIVVDGGKVGDYREVLTARERKKQASAKGEDYKNSGFYKMLHASENFKSKIRQKEPTMFYSMQAGANLATQLAKQYANYYISDIGRASGDSNYQAQVNRTIEIIGDVEGMLSGAISGASAGAATGNIAGVAIGALAGLTSSAVSLGFKYAEKDRSFQHERFKQNTSQAYNLTRANYSSHTGRVR